MERKLSRLILATLVAITLAGCSATEGPNDPQMSGKDIKAAADKMLTPEQKAVMDKGPGTLSNNPQQIGKTGNR